MIQINLITTMDFLKKYGGWILSAVLILCMLTCSGNSSTKEVRKYRDTENKAYQKTIDSLFKANASKDKIITKSEEKVRKSETKISDLEKKLSKEKQKGEIAVAKVKNYNLKEWRKFYQERSGYGEKQISETQNALTITREPLVAIANQLIQGDVARAELKITSEILAQTKSIVLEKDNIIKNEREKNVNLLSSIESQKNIQENLEKNIGDLEKDLKKAKKPKLKPIIISAILGGVAGAIIAK